MNTLLIQEVLSDPVWRRRFTAKDYRAITPMLYAHINPHELYILDLDKRLPIESSGRRAEETVA